jgi:hypothetical protein
MPKRKWRFAYTDRPVVSWWRKPAYKELATNDPIFDAIASILLSRGIRMSEEVRLTLHGIAVKKARPGHPAQEALKEIEWSLRRGALLSSIIDTV